MSNHSVQLKKWHRSTFSPTDNVWFAIAGEKRCINKGELILSITISLESTMRASVTADGADDASLISLVSLCCLFLCLLFSKPPICRPVYVVWCGFCLEIGAILDNDAHWFIDPVLSFQPGVYLVVAWSASLSRMDYRTAFTKRRDQDEELRNRKEPEREREDQLAGKDESGKKGRKYLSIKKQLATKDEIEIDMMVIMVRDVASVERRIDSLL